MKIKTTCQWYVNEIPKRCRNPRPVLHEQEMEFDIEELSVGDERMKPAFIVHEKLYMENPNEQEHVTMYSFKGRLWVKAQNYSEPSDIQRRIGSETSVNDEAGASRFIRETQENFLIVGGEVYTTVGEPYYQLSSTGWGNNPYVGIHYHFGEDSLHTSDFRADEYDLLVQVGKYRFQPSDSGKNYFETLKERLCFIEVLDNTAIRLPSFENRATAHIENTVVECLTDMKFMGDVVGHPMYQVLRDECCKRIYNSPEYRQTAYHIATYNIRELVPTIILDLIQKGVESDG